MSDWRECRVVRDVDGGLWGCDTPGPKAYWTGSEIEVSSDRLDEWHGPLTPVLDADGLPVVRTVGDLAARHVGRRVTVPEGTGVLVRMLDGQVTVDLDGLRPWYPLDTPCELLPEGDA